MSGVPDDLRDLIDAYVAGDIEETQLCNLEQRLVADSAARHYFVRYCHLETQLHLEMRGRRAGAKALQRLETAESNSAAPFARSRTEPGVGRTGTPRARVSRRRVLGVVAATLLLTLVSLGWWFTARQAGVQVAWLANAQNCRWSDGTAPRGDLRPGSMVSLDSGLAEIHFRSGVRVIAQGPASLELLSANSARLVRGRLTAHVPDAARGFQVMAPQGRVVDLGTEFGIAIAPDGSTEVQVFSGKVEAYGSRDAREMVGVLPAQRATIADGRVALRPASLADESAFVREITPPPIIVPRSHILDFRAAPEGSLRDRDGRGTGLTARLPGTGAALADHDDHLRLDPGGQGLEVIATQSDINTQFLVEQGEYLGLRLSDLGFTGREDFEVSVTVPNIPALQAVAQFGLYAGIRSDRNIRGGLISHTTAAQYGQFLVNNDGGRDADLHVVGLLSSGDDFRLTLRRTGNCYALTVENRSTGGSSIVTIRHPDFLDEAEDLYVGFFAANPQGTVSAPLWIRELTATVWTHESEQGASLSREDQL